MATQQTVNAVNGVDMNTLLTKISVIKEDPELGKMGKSRFRTCNAWVSGDCDGTTIAGFYGAQRELRRKRSFDLHADEPALSAGENQGGNSVEHLLNAPVACMTKGMVACAGVRGIHIAELESELEGDIDLNGFLGLDESVPTGISDIRGTFRVKADLDKAEGLRRPIEYSLVYNMITRDAKVQMSVELTRSRVARVRRYV